MIVSLLASAAGRAGTGWAGRGGPWPGAVTVARPQAGCAVLVSRLAHFALGLPVEPSASPTTACRRAPALEARQPASLRARRHQLALPFARPSIDCIHSLPT